MDVVTKPFCLCTSVSYDKILLVFFIGVTLASL